MKAAQTVVVDQPNALDLHGIADPVCDIRLSTLVYLRKSSYSQRYILVLLRIDL